MSNIENYIYKTYSDETKFTADGNKIQLKEYMDNLVFYHPCSSIKAEYASTDKTGEATSQPSIYDHGKFATCLKVSSPITYNYKNFETLNNKGTISFYTGVNELQGYCYQSILASSYPSAGLPAGTYSITIQVGNNSSHILVITLTATTTFSEFKNKMLYALDPSIYFATIDYSDTTNIRIKSTLEGKLLTITSGTTDTDLLSVVSLGELYYASYPSADTDLLCLSNGTDNKSKIEFKHQNVNSVSYLYVYMYDNDGTLKTTLKTIWNNDGANLDNIELDFNEDIAYLFLEGVLKDFAATGFTRQNNSTKLILNGTSSDMYTYDEIIIKSIVSNTVSFTPSTTSLTKYSTERPYIDFHFSGTDIASKSLNVFSMEASSNISCILYFNSTAYYYYSGSWRTSDGTFSQSNDYYTFTEKLASYPFDGTDFYIRCFFDSDGTTLSYISSIYFTIDESTLEDSNGDSAAVLVGSNEITGTVALTGKTLTITTDKGSTDITFTADATLDEILAKIKEAAPEGISKVGNDTTNKVYLVSSTLGSSGTISVSGDAAPLIFGSSTSAAGEDASSSDVDYTDFYNDVKSNFGYPLIPFDITQSQLDIFCRQATNLYNRYRSDKISTITLQLSGSPSQGYKIPSIIGDYKNIVDIIFKPIFPLNFYGSELVGDGAGDNIMSLLLARSLFGTSGVGGFNRNFTEDYYVSLMSIQDLKQTLGINPHWEIMNDRLFIYPAGVSTYTKVCIKYRGQATVKEMMKDWEYLDYVTGLCMQESGRVKQMYGGTLSAGSVAATFNGESLASAGKEKCDKVLESWVKSQTEPMYFIFG